MAHLYLVPVVATDSGQGDAIATASAAYLLFSISFNCIHGILHILLTAQHLQLVMQLMLH
jgi:hypothetical protein